MVRTTAIKRSKESVKPCSMSLARDAERDRAFRGLSDGSIGVEHHSELAADGSRWEVSSEFSLHDAAVSVGVNDLAPDALEVSTILSVLRSVNVGNALSVVERAGLAVVEALDSNEHLVFLLGPLSASESKENRFLVQSNARVMPITKLT